MNEIFKTNLRAALAEREWTQERLAREIDTSNRTVSGWCLGETLPQPNRLAQLAKRLDRDPGWFYTNHEQVDQKVIAETFGIDQSNVSLIVNRKRWRDI